MSRSLRRLGGVLGFDLLVLYSVLVDFSLRAIATRCSAIFSNSTDWERRELTGCFSAAAVVWRGNGIVSAALALCCGAGLVANAAAQFLLTQ